MSKYKLFSKEGYNDGYYWDMRYYFELDGKRYILTDIGSLSGYIPCYGEIVKVKDDWIDVPDDLSKEDAIHYVKQLKESDTKVGEAFVLWDDDEDEYELKR